MLTGFEEQTEELTDNEMRLARIAYKAMNTAFNSGDAITNDGIADVIKRESGQIIAPSRIRKMINWMHTTGHLPGLIASSKGYSRASNVKELSDYADSLKGRITAIQQRLNAVKRDINNHVQTDLFQ